MNLSMSYGISNLTPLLTSFRADGEVGTGVFYLINPAPGTANLFAHFGVTGPTSGVGRIAALTFSGVDLSNPFGSSATNNDLSTGIQLSGIEAGNITLYSIAAVQGLGPADHHVQRDRPPHTTAQKCSMSSGPTRSILPSPALSNYWAKHHNCCVSLRPSAASRALLSDTSVCLCFDHTVLNNACELEVSKGLTGL